MPATVAHRNNQLAQIHIARGQLHMSEDEYRDLLSAKFNGIRSAAQLSDAQRLQLLDHFQRLGWKGRVPGSQANATGKAPLPGASSTVKRVPWSPGTKKLYSLWQQLADANLVGDRGAKALSAWCKRMTAGMGGRAGVERVEWLSPPQLHHCTEAAKRWLARGVDASHPGDASIDAPLLAQARLRKENQARLAERAARDLAADQAEGKAEGNKP